MKTITETGRIIWNSIDEVGKKKVNRRISENGRRIYEGLMIIIPMTLKLK